MLHVRYMSWKKCAVLHGGGETNPPPPKKNHKGIGGRTKTFNVAKSTCNPSHPKIDIWLGMPCQRQFRSL